MSFVCVALGVFSVDHPLWFLCMFFSVLLKLTEGRCHSNHSLKIQISLKQRLSGSCTLTRQQTCTQAGLANAVCEFFLRNQSQVTLPGLVGICLSVPWALDLGAVSVHLTIPGIPRGVAVSCLQFRAHQDWNGVSSLDPTVPSTEPFS